MDEPTTCPRGHPVAAAATRCTVCGMHVVPVAPNPFDPPARTVARHRRPRSWRRVRIAPIVGALIVVAVVAGWIVGAQFLAPPPDPVVAAASTAATETAVAVSVPQAGTVTSPSATPAPPSATSSAPASEPSAADTAGSPSAAPAVAVDGCTVAGVTSPTACSPSGERVTFPVCVPSEATAVAVRTRKTQSSPWKAPADKADLQGRGSCPAGEVEAQLTIKIKAGLTKLVRVTVRDRADETVATVRASVTRSTTP